MGYNNYGLFLEIFVNKSQTQNSLILFSLFKFLNTILSIFYIQFTPSFLLDVQRYIYRVIHGRIDCLSTNSTRPTNFVNLQNYYRPDFYESSNSSPTNQIYKFTRWVGL